MYRYLDTERMVSMEEPSNVCKLPPGYQLRSDTFIHNSVEQIVWFQTSVLNFEPTRIRVYTHTCIVCLVSIERKHTVRNHWFVFEPPQEQQGGKQFVFKRWPVWKSEPTYICTLREWFQWESPVMSANYPLDTNHELTGTNHGDRWNVRVFRAVLDH